MSEPARLTVRLVHNFTSVATECSSGNKCHVIDTSFHLILIISYTPPHEIWHGSAYKYGHLTILIHSEHLNNLVFKQTDYLTVSYYPWLNAGIYVVSCIACKYIYKHFLLPCSSSDYSAAQIPGKQGKNAKFSPSTPHTYTTHITHTHTHTHTHAHTHARTHVHAHTQIKHTHMHTHTSVHTGLMADCKQGWKWLQEEQLGRASLLCLRKRELSSYS